MPAVSPQVIEQDADAGDFSPPDVIDVDAVVEQTLIDHGFSNRNREGVLIFDKAELQKAVREAMESHVATNKKDLDAKAVTKAELYAEVLPNGPGVQSIADNPDWIAVQKKLQDKVWGIASTGVTGHVQKGVGPSGMILCEAEVSRTNISEETGKKVPSTQIARFLTVDHQLILKYYTGPGGADFTRAGRKLETKLSMVTKRQPELTVGVARQMAAVLKQVIGALPHADVKQALALTASALSDAAEEESA
jgi:hypothetical protein